MAEGQGDGGALAARLFAPIAPTYERYAALLSFGIAGVWIFAHVVAALLFIWEVDFPDWAFPLRGRWLRHFLSGSTVLVAVLFALAAAQGARHLIR